MDFYNYLLKLYEEKTEGASNYDCGDPDDNFQDDINSFFESLLIWEDDIKKMINQFGAEIIPAALHRMAAEKLNPVNYTDLESFVNLALNETEDQYYNAFKEVFLKQ